MAQPNFTESTLSLTSTKPTYLLEEILSPAVIYTDLGQVLKTHY
jgi:hypothetical protein